jgi:hypothetical protein
MKPVYYILSISYLVISQAELPALKLTNCYSMGITATLPSCPVCNTNYRKQSVICWLNREYEVWSDGYRNLDISHEFPMITRCDVCFNYFWVRNSRKPGYKVPGDLKLGINRVESKEMDKHLRIRNLTPEELADTLALKVYRDQDEERYLRFNLWWTINSIHRNGHTEEISPEIQEIFNENLETLIYKTSPDSPENLIILAEMYRELGQFKDASKRLDLLGGTLSGVAVSLKMRQKIAQGDKKVFLI